MRTLDLVKFSEDMRKTLPILILLFIFTQCRDSHQKTLSKYSLKKIGEIKNELLLKDNSHFVKITGLCCDDKDNLYVADIGLCNIIKFSSNGEYLATFGREGQGPGEFLCGNRYCRLKVTFGGDRRIYVIDTGNSRLHIFNPDGSFIEHFPLPPFSYDTAQVNTKGDIYLLSRSGIKIVDCFTSYFTLNNYLLDHESPQDFPYYKPKMLKLGNLHDREYIILLTEKDHLIVISNYSLNVFHFDQAHNLLNKFRIDNKSFINDLEYLYDTIKRKKKSQRSKSTSTYVLPFSAFLDKDINICLVYRNSQKIFEIYRYKTDSTFLDILKFPEGIDGWNICANSMGLIYCTQDNRTKISIFNIERR